MFLGDSPEWYKNTIIAFLIINPIILLLLNISTYSNSYEELIFPQWVYTFSYLLGNLLILIASLLSTPKRLR